MHIKTIPWTFRGWGQLISYIGRDRGTEEDYGLEIFHNVWASEEPGDIVEQFRENDAYRPERKGQTGLVHEVISFSGDDRGRLTPEIIQTLAEEWLARRAPNALAYGCVHQDRAHLHLHLVLSANEYQSPKSTRLDLKDFYKLRRELEFFSREHFPEQTQNSIAYTGEMEIPKRDRLTKDQVAELVHEALGGSSRIDDVNRTLAPHGFEVYTYKGRPAGVRQGNRKFRWKRLGYEQSPELEYPDPEREAVIEEEPSAQTRSEPPPARESVEEPARLEGTPTADLPGRFDWTGETDMWERELEGRESFLEPDLSEAEPSPAFNFADGVDSSGGSEGGFWEVGYNIYSKTRMAVDLVAQGTRITSKVIGRGISTAYNAIKKSQQARSAVERADSPPEPAKPQAPSRNSPEDQRKILEALLELGETPDRERDFDIER